MKNRTLIISLFLFSIILISFNFGFSIAHNNENSIKILSEPNEDGVDNNFEEFNKRDIEIDNGSNEITIISTRRNDIKNDQIRINIGYDGDGIRFQFQYRSNLESDFELMFDVIFYALIEFVDIDIDGIYDPEVDQEIQNFTFSDFSPLFYNKTNISSDSDLYYIQIQTQNKNFTVHIYFAEEFAIIGNSLITPAQGKIDIEIANFGYINASSQLALYTKLDSGADYYRKEDTEDEKNGYAINEEGLGVSIDDYNGFFSWKKKALIDSISNNILISEVMPDENDAQKIYINYPRGNHIIHESKLGVEGILITNPLISFFIITLVVAIGAISTITAYSIYYSKKHQFITKNDKRNMVDDFTRVSERHEFDDLFDSELALKILEGEGAIEKLYLKGDINITAISEDFKEIIDRFDFKGNEKSEFIKEMLSLPPDEREAIIREMLMKSE